jgi:hypothetical protein
MRASAPVAPGCLITLLIVLVLAGGCDVAATRPDFTGYYLDKAQVILNPDPYARRPSQLETGDHWMVWLSSFQKRGWLMSGRSRQTTVFFEFTSRPILDTSIDLATAPLQASYEYGGEAALYISRTVTGTMTLSQGEGNSYLATIDATFSNPILGEGSQSFKGEIVLQKHPHPDFTTP